MSSTPMHALEALTFVLGEFVTIDGVAALRRPIVLAIEDSRPLAATAFDHIALAGSLQSGALASILFRGARLAETTCVGKSMVRKAISF